MQINEIKAFRQRLYRAGYSDVSIYYSKISRSVDVYFISPDGEKGHSNICLSELFLYPLKFVKISYLLP